jgi:integrase/recombinase XerC
MTFKELVDAHINAKMAANLRPESLRNYERRTRGFVKFLGAKGIVQLEDLTPELIQAYLADRLREGLKPSTVKGFRDVIIGMCNWAYRRGYDVPRSVLWAVDKVRVDHEEPRYLLPAEVAELVHGVDAARYRTAFARFRDGAMVRMLLDTGVRQAELIALNLDDVDMERRSIKIRMSKSRKFRTVYFGHDTGKWLRDYLTERNDNTDPALWITMYGGRISSGLVQQLARRWAAAAGLRDVHCHTLRHTTATCLLRNGMRIEHVQRVLGHSKIEMTLHYAHILGEDTYDAYQAAAPMDRLHGLMAAG